jgi:serine/threonine-protein kinase
VLYEMLTGTKPFQGEDIPELMFKVANMPATPPSHLAPDLPAVVDFIIARALKKRPEERYAAAADMAKDLHAALREMGAVDEAMAERHLATTVPDVAPASAPSLARDEPLELRPSPRFGSAAGLARLSVLPAHADDTSSRAGWTVQMKREPRRVDAARVAVALALVLATLFAIAMVLV